MQNIIQLLSMVYTPLPHTDLNFIHTTEILGEHVNKILFYIIYSTDQRKGKRYPRAIRGN